MKDKRDTWNFYWRVKIKEINLNDRNIRFIPVDNTV